ncbi:hypothetical protein SDJN03_12321, partial [Cucurbita argyrosperma subsp. sororia]
MEVGDEDGVGAFERVRLGGRNIGASMSVSHGSEGKLPNCCCINIYVNSNIQGVNNSTLNGSEISSSTMPMECNAACSSCTPLSVGFRDENVSFLRFYFDTNGKAIGLQCSK